MTIYLAPVFNNNHKKPHDYMLEFFRICLSTEPKLLKKKIKAAPSRQYVSCIQIKVISKIRDLSNAIKGSWRMSISEASSQETVFLVTQPSLTQWFRLCNDSLCHFIIYTDKTNYGIAQAICHLKYALENFMLLCLQVEEFWDYNLGDRKHAI